MKRIPFRLEETQEYQDLLRQQEAAQSRTPATAIAQALQAKNVGPVAADPSSKAQREYDYATQPPEVVRQGIAMLPESMQSVAEFFAPSRADLLTAGVAKLGSLAAKATGLAKPAQGMVRELITYHGTPHRFPEAPDNPLGAFDASKIGTGEGAQAYGYGIYVAESPGVAAGYKKALGKREFEIAGRKIYASSGLSSHVLDKQSRAETIAADALDEAIDSQSAAPAQFAANRLRQQAKQYPDEAASINDALNIIADWQESGAATNMAGALYTVDLPDTMIDKMLDWDAPLSKQPKSVQELTQRLRSLPNDPYNLERYFSPQNPNKGPLGGEIYEAIAQHFEKSDDAWKELGLTPFETRNIYDAASRYASRLGIPGVKYLDGGSRGSGGGTRNFVVFPGEEQNLKILNRE